MCVEDRITGAVRIGDIRTVTDNAEKPKDAQVKTEKNIKEKFGVERN